MPAAHLHLYGKEEARVGRKMGHVNFTAETRDDAVAAANACAQLLRAARLRRRPMSIALPNTVTPARIDAAAALLDAGSSSRSRPKPCTGSAAMRRIRSRRAHLRGEGRPANHPVIVHLPPGGDRLLGRRRSGRCAGTDRRVLAGPADADPEAPSASRMP
jgi:hypothetical protein